MTDSFDSMFTGEVVPEIDLGVADSGDDRKAGAGILHLLFPAKPAHDERRKSAASGSAAGNDGRGGGYAYWAHKNLLIAEMVAEKLSISALQIAPEPRSVRRPAPFLFPA
jgi:hypothetical protein